MSLKSLSNHAHASDRPKRKRKGVNMKKFRMGRNSYAGLLEDWKVRMIAARAKKMGFLPHEIDDALQDIVPVIMEFRYDPEKADGCTEEHVLRICIDRQLAMIVRKTMCARKHYQRYKVLTNPAVEPMTEDSNEASAFSMDVAEMLAKLPPKQRAACEAIAKAPSLDEAAASLGTTRYLLQRTLDEVQERFTKEGF